MPISPTQKKIYNQRYREKKRLEKMQQQQEEPLNEITVDENESVDTVQEIKPIHVPEPSMGCASAWLPACCSRLGHGVPARAW